MHDRDQLGPVTIHVLYDDLPLCRFSLRPFEHWPAGHIWVGPEQFEANAEACNDPEHELHSVLPYTMCDACGRAMVTGEVPDDVPAVGRTTKDGERLTDAEVVLALEGACPDCGELLLNGPRGGLSINRYCSNAGCGSRFNFLGPRAELGIDRITDAMPRAKSRGQPS